MPNEKVVYLGDTARLPYGSKSAETIIKFSEENARFLLQKDVKIIVVACNSSSSYAVPMLQNSLDIPVIGVIDAGSEAAIKSSQKKIGVIGTAATISSEAYTKTILEKHPGLEIVSSACPLFVPLVEEGWIDHRVTRMVIEEYLMPLKEKGIDTLVLGCTHYPVLKEPIADVIGNEITLIDSGITTADWVYVILNSLGWLTETDVEKKDTFRQDEFYVTDFPERFKKVGEIFLKRQIPTVNVADI
jgi:glutamate racemase